jgi:outer membrane lipoprotein carrier protein
VVARPKRADSGFELMRLGFAGSALKRMEMRDNFGQTTLVTFTRFVANPSVDAARFRFTPPAGADVVGDTGGSR